MNLQKKLKTILKISGKTQQETALDLGVSFATLNSWINGRSEPHSKNIAKISEFYLRLTGYSTIPESELRAKKELLAGRVRLHKNLIVEILKNKDIFDQFVLSLTYHTNRIEGSSLTEDDTAAILFDNVSLPDKSLIEQLEAKNHQTALKFLFDYLKSGGVIDQNLVLKLHGILMNSVRDDAGLYRRRGVRIVGANIPAANYLKIPDLMDGLGKKITAINDDLVAHVADVHAEFEKIHPFSDGNGRVGRLLLCAMLLQNNYPPAVIEQEKRRQYMAYLNKAQQGSDSNLLQDFLCDAILVGFNILKRK